MKQHTRVKLLLLLPLLLTLLSVHGCTRKPLTRVPVTCTPEFADDLDRTSLKHSLEVSLDYLAGRPGNQEVAFGEHIFTQARLTRSIQIFLDILAANPTSRELNVMVKTSFDVYQAGGTAGFNPRRTMLVTGYYQPIFEGSLTRQGDFIHPLYSVPADLAKQIGNDGRKTFGRMENDRFLPYWTRADIETRDKAAGHELVWLKDPFEAFILHVQGSGLVRLQDGTIRGVQYAAKNGWPYRSIGKYMVETGRLTLKEAGLDTIRAYLASHPDERQEILHHNQSFIFFRWHDGLGASGNLGRQLTGGRSIATDQSLFPAGGLGFLVSRKPVADDNGGISGWTPLRRFVTVQDTGSAIRGPGRVDLFWGTGERAGREAGIMKEPGQLYFLIAKE